MNKELGFFGRGLKRAAPAAALGISLLLSRDAKAGAIVNPSTQPIPTPLSTPRVESSPVPLACPSGVALIDGVCIPIASREVLPTPTIIVLPVVDPIGVEEAADSVGIKCKKYPSLEVELRVLSHETAVVTFMRKLFFSKNAEEKALGAAERGDKQETSRQLLILRKGDDLKREILLRAYMAERRRLQKKLQMFSEDDGHSDASALVNFGLAITDICDMGRIDQLQKQIENDQLARSKAAK